MTPFPNLSHGHSQEVSPLLFQSKTVAAIFPFCVLRKQQRWSPHKHPAQLSAPKSRFITPETQAPFSPSLKWTPMLLLGGACNSKSMQNKREGRVCCSMIVAQFPHPPSCLPPHDLLGSKDSTLQFRSRSSSILMVSRGRDPNLDGTATI